jgi:hypothetical protein
MADHCIKLGRRIGDLSAKAKDHRPAVGRGSNLTATLVQLGQPDERHQVKLIDRQRFFQRITFGIVVTGQAVRHGQVHPKRDRRWIRCCRGSEMGNGLFYPAGLQGSQAESVLRLGITRAGAQGLSPQ